MEGMEEKLGAILNNPQMMQQIMAMAQSLGNQAEPEVKKESARQPDSLAPAIPDIDVGMIQRLSSLAGQSSIDQDQQTLLKALSPYLSHDRMGKLERAMRAAKMARMASSLLGSGVLHF